MLENPSYMALQEEEEERKLINRAYRSLLRSIKTPRTKHENNLIRKAFELAVEAHKEQRRKSGEPYILHPIAVARICAEEIGLDTTSIISALLHDTVEDTDVSLQTIQAEFGQVIRNIVDGLTKFDNMFDVESPQAENFRKVLSTLATDVRVALVKMADRLHNMRTIHSMSQNKKTKIAAETLYIYAPLAHRLGLYNIKTEFEDLCMEVLEPDHYQMIEEQLERTRKARDFYIRNFISLIKPRLDELDIPYRIFGRIKAISSIWNKMKNKKVTLEQIYDIFAVRIVFDLPISEEKLACWRIYSTVTDIFQPLPERLKDWVSTPKSNGYESLHTTVFGPNGRKVEIQIRSERMNEVAEKGLAAHWKYKEKSAQTERIFERWLAMVRDFLESPAENAVDFINDFKNSFFVEEIFVFSPKGDMYVLPVGATALDFAFAVHTEVGTQCSAVKVDGRLVPMGTKLKNGVQVEVLRSKNQKPNEDWLKMVVTSKAKTRIRHALKEEKRRVGEFGKETLARKLKSIKANFDDYNIDFLVKYFDFNNRTDLYYAIAKENVLIQKELKKFALDGGQLSEYKDFILKENNPEPAIPAKRTFRKLDNAPKLLIDGDAADQYVYELATCCNPVQGDEIFAFTTASGVMKVHRNSCPNAVNMMANYGYRIKKAEWGNTTNTDFVAHLRITGMDTIGVVQRITDVITNRLHINMRSIKMEGGEGYFVGDISVVVYNKDQLHHLILTLKSLEEVNNIVRLTPDEMNLAQE